MAQRTVSVLDFSLSLGLSPSQLMCETFLYWPRPGSIWESNMFWLYLWWQHTALLCLHFNLIGPLWRPRTSYLESNYEEVTLKNGNTIHIAIKSSYLKKILTLKLSATMISEQLKAFKYFMNIPIRKAQLEISKNFYHVLIFSKSSKVRALWPVSLLVMSQVPDYKYLLVIIQLTFWYIMLSLTPVFSVTRDGICGAFKAAHVREPTTEFPEPA